MIAVVCGKQWCGVGCNVIHWPPNAATAVLPLLCCHCCAATV